MTSATGVRWREWVLSRASNAYRETAKDWPADIRSVQGTVGECAIHPIKSLGRLALKHGMYISRQGLQTLDKKVTDRALMLAIRKPGDVSGMPYEFARFSQRQDGCLASVMPTYDGKVLRYQATNMRDLIVYPEQLRECSNRRAFVRMASDAPTLLPASTEDGSITDWIREYLGKAQTAIDPKDIVVLNMMPSFTRNVETAYARGTFAEMQFTDDSYGLLASMATCFWMNDVLNAQDRSSFKWINIWAFRPNVILYGLQPNLEDVIDEIQVEGGPKVLCTKLCVRCIATHVDPCTGAKRADKQPLKFLSEHRPSPPDKPNGPTFGINWLCDHESEGKIIQPGQTFTVLSEKN